MKAGKKAPSPRRPARTAAKPAPGTAGKTDPLFDETSGLPLYMARVDRAAEALARDGVLGVLAVRMIDSLRVEASLGSGVFERTLRRAAGVIRARLEHAGGGTWELTVNGFGGDILLVFLSRARDGAPVSEETLFLLKEELQDAEVTDLALRVGYALVYPQPSVNPRRLVYRGAERAMASALGDESSEFERQNQTLKRIIFQSHIRTVYQPIVPMEGGAPFAYEALTRGPAETEFESPDFLFALSRRSGLLLELDFLCRNVAVSSAAAVPPGAKLFVNVLAHTLSHRRFLEPRFLGMLDAAEIEPARVVFEVSEKYPISDYSDFRQNTAELRRHGFALAVDDAGMGYSNLRTLYELEPEYVKMDHSLVRRIHAEPVHEKVFRVLAELSERLGAVVIAEGIETEAELLKLRGMGVRYGQGFYFSEPNLLGVAAAG
jgi:EAL domain-containing protein (putative c-di-GMP-specific phosphodiesterase class I)